MLFLVYTNKYINGYTVLVINERTKYYYSNTPEPTIKASGAVKKFHPHAALNIIIPHHTERACFLIIESFFDHYIVWGDICTRRKQTDHEYIYNRLKISIKSESIRCRKFLFNYMNRFVLICLFFAYYVVWSLLPIFEIENSNPIISFLFPISSDVAIFLPIFLLLIGFTLTGSLLGALLLRSDKKKNT